jgi:SMC interacting uncharacterized protein involved in chromosome segregation
MLGVGSILWLVDPNYHGRSSVMKQLIVIGALMICASGAWPISSVVVAQSPMNVPAAPDQDKHVLIELLQEMRQLRVALQRMQAVSQRTQVTLERIRLQQNRVDSISRTLENLRTHLADIRAARPSIEEDMRDMDELFNRTTDATKRSEIEAQIKETKTRLSAQSREEEQSRQRELELTADLQAGQAKLNDLNSQLDTIIRELEAP